MKHVAFLAGDTVPNDCGIWVAVRSMMEALIRYGSFQYTFEINESQADVAERCKPTSRVRFVDKLSDRIPRATWVDGVHPSFRRLDALRDLCYRALPRDWSLSKHVFAREVRRIGADLYHCPFEELPFWPRQKAFIYTQMVHDFQPAHLPELQTRARLNRLGLDYRTYRKASAVCVLGETCKQDAIRFANLSPERIFVTPYGAWETPPPASLEFRDEVRRKFGLPEAFIFYPAPTRPHKNHARLIRALEALKKKGTRVPLVTTGKEHPYYGELQDIICSLGMESDVVFTDYVDLKTLYALYDMAAAVVLPTLFEGATGIPLLEALSKGKPVAAARTCEIPAALGDSGLIFDPRSEAEIAAAIERLWESPSLREELSAKACEMSSRRSWADFAKMTEKAFQYAADHPAH